MPELNLKFHIRLTKRFFDPLIESGPLFHRWLPNGKKDALVLTQPEEQEQITVWFERRMVSDNGFLRWNPDGTQFDPNLMERQCKIEAGILFGDMKATISKAESVAIANSPIKIGDTFGQYDPASAEYVQAGKRISEKIQQKVRLFVSRLRTQYGQYWLEDVLPWDSRQMSLGSYCNSTLGLSWFHEADARWCWFLPTPSMFIQTIGPMPGRGFSEYLTEADWRALQTHRCQSDVSLGVEMLGTATEALDTGNWSYAFVTVATALEFALAERMQSGKSDPKIMKALNSFSDHETLPARAAVVLLAAGAPAHEVKAVLSTIEIRNRIAHEGYQPKDQEARDLRPVMQTIRFLMQLDELKTPILTNSNRLEPPLDRRTAKST
jgi:hypothetical protein